MRFLFVLIVFALSACTIAPTKIVPIDNANQAWESRKTFLYEQDEWVAHLSLIGIAKKEKFKTRIIWQQNYQNYQIKLRDFIGRTVAVIDGSPQKVVVTTSKGKRYEDQDAETLIYGLFGLRIPVAGMRYWLRGVPQPETEYQELNLRADGLAASMRQVGWQLSYQNYADNEAIKLPAHALFEYDDLALTVKVARWELSTAQ